MLVPIAGAVVHRRWPHVSEVLGILIATAGLVLMTAPSLSVQFNLGDLLTLACAVAFAFHLLALGHYSQRERFEAVALGQILCAAVLSTLALPGEPPRVSGRAMSCLRLR